MTKLILILILGTQLVSANPLLEAIDRSDVAQVASIFEEKKFSKEVLKDLLDEAFLVKELRDNKALNTLDLINRVVGSALCVVGASLIADGILTSPYTLDQSRSMAYGNPFFQSAKTLNRGPKDYAKIVGGALASCFGYYFARKGFKQQQKKSLSDNAYAIEEIIHQQIDRAVDDDSGVLATDMSLKEARLALEDSLVASDFYGVRKAVHALKFYGVTLSRDRVDYTNLATQILTQRQQEIALLSSGEDMAKTGIGAGGFTAGLYGLIVGARKLRKTISFEWSHKIALADYGSALRILGAGVLVMSLGKYLFSDGGKRTAQKRRLYMAEQIEKYIRERS